MAEMGNGYGSECHLLRWMGRHREAFDRVILEKIGENHSSIKWLDFKFNPNATWPDAELKGLEFLIPDDSLESQWRKFWPTQGNVPNWDAVGWLTDMYGKKELLLVEAKAHVEEIKSNCQAKSEKSIERIDVAFKEVKSRLGIVCDNDWKKEYYQFANRLATLYFLDNHGIAARLLFIYFIGDKFPKKFKYICPKSPEKWTEALNEQYHYLGLSAGHELQKQICTLFLRIDSDERLTP